MSPHRVRRKVLVSIPTEQHAERLKLEGVLKFAHEKSGDRWDVVIDVGGRLHPDADGIIAYVTSPVHRRKLLAAHRPTILIEDLTEQKRPSRRTDVVTLLCDHKAEGRTAGRYFLDRHFRNFAFVGTGDEWSDLRRDGYCETVGNAGFDCPSVSIDEIGDLPRPCAVFAAHDILARLILTKAEELGIAVPDELAVLGVDNDEVMCTTSAPALSSIPTFDRSLGYAAGRALNELFLHRAGGRIIRTRHTHVVSRASTEKDAVSDPFVARTLSWIRQHLSGKLDAATLARQIGYSRHMLQIRVEKALGVTLGEQIRRMRLAAAEGLLLHTDRPIAEVAASCGFTSASHLALRFRQAHGMTPLKFRRKASLSSRHPMIRQCGTPACKPAADSPPLSDTR
ncbi:MAG: substrate-binding domain-containing protein [Kiritimatiellia bacterium]